MFNKFASSGIGGVWSSSPIDEQVVRRAELYLEKILRKNDVSNAESVAISAAALFLKENDLLLKGLVKSHTDLMENFGLDEAIILFQNDCPFGFNEIKCESAFKGHENFDILFNIASHGARRTISETFCPQSYEVHSTSHQNKFSDVFLAHALKSAMEAQAMIIETSKIPIEMAKQLHYSDNVFTSKPGVDLGRCCINLSKNEKDCFLNTPLSKLGAEALYGKAPICPQLGIFVWVLSRSPNHLVFRFPTCSPLKTIFLKLTIRTSIP